VCLLARSTRDAGECAGRQVDILFAEAAVLREADNGAALIAGEAVALREAGSDVVRIAGEGALAVLGEVVVRSRRRAGRAGELLQDLQDILCLAHHRRPGRCQFDEDAVGNRILSFRYGAHLVIDRLGDVPQSLRIEPHVLGSPAYVTGGLEAGVVEGDRSDRRYQHCRNRFVSHERTPLFSLQRMLELQHIKPPLFLCQ